jgi:uncharacterized protein DUF5069
MEPLSLRTNPPRSPREQVAGLMFLPRTIDKARALLPGGDPAGYFISPGLSAWLLGKLGLGEANFLAVVASAPDEAHVAATVCGRISEERLARWNATMASLTVAEIGPELREAFDRLYGPRDPDALVIDVLAADDDGG